MPDDGKTPEGQNSNTRSIDWTRKGFGWVPDYPDIRDFFPFPSITGKESSLQKAVQKAGVIDAIDDLRDQLIKVLEILTEKKESDDTEDKPEKSLEIKLDETGDKADKSLKAALEELKTKTDGGIRFRATRVYRVLSKNTPQHKSYDDQQQNDREHEQEILQLKKCLYFLYQKENLANKSLPKDKSGHLPDLGFNKMSTKERIEWLTSPKFDDDTEALVKDFQSKHFEDTKLPKDGIKLREDGIVGLNTFLMLEFCLNKPEICKHKQYQSSDFNDSAKVKNPAKLVTISSIVPDQVFGELIDYLYVAWLERYNPANLSSPLPSDWHISSNDLITILNLSEKGKSARDNQAPARKIITQFIEEKIKTKEICIKRSHLIELCKHEFLIIDPIVSVILMMNTPLANQGSIKKFVLKGIQKFEELLDLSEDENKLLALSAVLVVKETLEIEKSELIDDIEKSKLNLEKKVQEIDDLKKKVQEIASNYNDQCEKKVNTLEEEVNTLLNNLIDNSYSTLFLYSLIKNTIFNWERKSEWEITRAAELIKHQEAPKDAISDSDRKKIRLTNKLIQGREEFSKNEHFELTSENLESKQQTQASRKCTGENAEPEKSQSRFLIRPEMVLPISSSSRFNADKGSPQVPYFLLPGAVDLSYWCSPVEDQGSLNTCTACAGVGLLEYFAKRTFGEFEDLSPLFLYKAARDLRHRFGDVGAPLRDIMRSMILFGVSPERYWPYQLENLDRDPPALCYSYAQNYQTLKYFRLDRADRSARDLLLMVKAVLAAGFPCMFGFTAYTSIHNQENVKYGYIPFPDRKRDRVVGGHAVIAVGYNDYKRIPYYDGTERAGAVLVRNSWGPEWGLGGYGWLPYDYILKGLTGDWWSLLQAEWFGQGYFGLEARDPGNMEPGQTTGNTTVKPPPRPPG